ncbi:MAG: hypothetical protein KC457_17205, partial [Myxococcales bacterium]|nr:hypothetical protein [Myxococcales bacterium]
DPPVLDVQPDEGPEPPEPAAATTGAGGETGQADAGAETGQAAVGAQTSDTGAETDTGEGDESDGAGTTTSSVAEAPDNGVDRHGWCHLHEDRYTLLARSRRRQSTMTVHGVCYVCRVEQRSSRTRNFSPRDCAGYSLCGPTNAGTCR